MATSEAVLSDHSHDEQVEKKINEEIRTMTEESVPPSKKNGGTGVEEKPLTEEAASSVVSVSISEENTEDIKTEPPVVVEIEKVKDTPDIPGEAEVFGKQPEEQPAVEAGGKQTEEQTATEVVEKQPDEQQAIEAAGKQPAVEAVGKQPEEQPAIEAVGNQLPEQSAIEVLEEQAKQQSDVLESSIEAVEKPMEHLEVFPVRESETKVMKEPEEVSEADAKIAENPASVIEVDKKSHEQYEVVEEVRNITEEKIPKGRVEDETAKDEWIPADKVSEKEAQTSAVEDLIAAESSDTVISANQDVETSLKEDGVCSSLPDVVEKVGIKDKEREEGGVDMSEGLPKEAALEMGKVEEEKEEEKEKVEQENVKIEMLTQPETAKSKEVSGSTSAIEVTEKSCEGQKASKDVEVVTEEKKEDVKDDIPASVETKKDRDVEGEVPDINTVTIIAHEPVGEPKKSNVEVKADETVQADTDNLEKTNEVLEEIPKSDAPCLESSMNIDDSKTSEDASKQDIPAKATQKQSNNIISKVKHSIVKVKKAIMGKSPSSKTISSEDKDVIKVK